MFFFFKWVRISPEIDWYHYQGASPALKCIVRVLNNDKDPYEVKCHIRAQCVPLLSPVYAVHLLVQRAARKDAVIIN